MHLATLRIEIRVRDGFRSKRRVVQSIVDKIHRHFNVSVAEVKDAGHPSDSVIAVAVVAINRRETREILDRVADAITVHPRLEVLDVQWTDL